VTLEVEPGSEGAVPVEARLQSRRVSRGGAADGSDRACSDAVQPERDRHRLGADAMARDSAGGMGL
jgi:hypothetical protein